MAATPPLSFSLPLKDTSKPVSFPGDFQNHIALEFAMRYLSEVGAIAAKVILHIIPVDYSS